MNPNTQNPLKVPFGTATGVRLRNVRFLPWEDAFDVDFEDRVSFLEPHSILRKSAAEQAISEEKALQRGMEGQSKAFAKNGAEVYAQA